MAISYSTLFHQIGSLIAGSNELAPIASTTLPNRLETILTQYGTASTGTTPANAPISGLDRTTASLQRQVQAMRLRYQQSVAATLTNYDTVTSQLPGLLNTSLTSVLQAILYDMQTNSQSVLANTVTIGSITPAATNVGNGTALFDATLDGYNAPLRGGFASRTYNGVLSQLHVPSDTHVLTCTADQNTGTVEGGESWSWSCNPSWQLFDWHTEGGGQGPGVTTAHSSAILTNLSFDTASGNLPTGWTAASGTPGTDIFSETSTVYRGAAALRFTGTGSHQPAVTQSFSSSSLQPRRRYCFTIRACQTGSPPGGGNLTINFTGGGYTAGPTEKISIPLTSLGATYAATGVLKFYWNTPATLPTAPAISIAITGANLAAGANVILDSASFAAVPYHNGVNLGIISGNVAWAVGDILYCTITNTTTGGWQDYFRRAMQVQLPSVGGGNTIAEGWIV